MDPFIQWLGVAALGVIVILVGYFGFVPYIDELTGYTEPDVESFAITAHSTALMLIGMVVGIITANLLSSKQEK